MPERYSRRILDYVADPRYEPRTIRQVARDLNVGDDEFSLFKQAAEQLLEEGQVLLGTSETLALPPVGKHMTGTFRLHERGFGFVVPESPTEHGDLFVPPGNAHGALTGDRVRAAVTHHRGRTQSGKSPYVGRVVEILQRPDRQYVGTLFRRGGLYLVDVDGRALHDPVVVRDPGAKNARAGDKVVVELITAPGTGPEPTPGSRRGRPASDPGYRELLEAVITERIGEAGEPDVETTAVIRAYGLREKFPPPALRAARGAAAAFDDEEVPADREDLTGAFVCTIDPPDARDFDDAISIRRLSGDADAAYELGVHIADVSHFVRAGSALDTEAHDRGNSTYLPRHVIPMLPEVLSNGVCSLQEGVNRFTMSCFIRYDAAGAVLDQRFARTVIRSRRRLTYLEAQALIDNDPRGAARHGAGGGRSKYGRELIETLKLMDELARTIRTRRFQAGMIALDLPEVQLIFDEAGRVVDAEPEDGAFTHTIIEMFMVEANEAAARLFDRLGVSMIRRIHPDPDPYDITGLRAFARVAGYNIPSRPTRSELQGLLDAVRGRPAQHAVHLAVLKTLSKAEYSPLIIGHFALASEHYTHFTSPIRRYPDFVIHRGLGAFLGAQESGGNGKGPKKRKVSLKALKSSIDGDKGVPDEKQMVEIGRHCTLTEKNSEAAERELRNYLVLELLAEHLGEDYDGTVTGVASSGVFVQLERYLVEGFVRAAELPAGGSGGDERWKLNRQTGALVAQRSGLSITIGDRFVVRVARVDLARRQMDLVIIDDRPGREKRKQPKGARAAHQKTQALKQVKKRDRRAQRGSGR